MWIMRHANKMNAEAMDDLAVADFRQKLRSLATYAFSTAQLLLKQLFCASSTMTEDVCKSSWL